MAASALSPDHLPRPDSLINARVFRLNLLAAGIGVAAAFVAQALLALIGLITNLSFYGRWSFASNSPAGNHLGWFVLFVPIVGGLIVGIMTRYGSEAIRGHGIPEAMEHVLMKESKIAPRVTILKPLSAAIAIGTGGPFGAEGPIIATGGALGSLVGQMLKITTDERRTLLAAGSAAGMAATFGCPVAAVLLAVELLLFEFSARSLIPVAFASVLAAGTRAVWAGTQPIFSMPSLAPAGLGALFVYIALGAAVGVASVFVTQCVFFVEDSFKKLPIHWMWWPAIGAIAVGVIAIVEPRTLGIGYENIDGILAGSITRQALLVLCVLKFVSWALSLGSGTSGGTLAPLFTIGGALGGTLGTIMAVAFPHSGIDPRMAALVGMAAMFAGASRAFLASLVFAFETTMMPTGVAPLLGGCAAAYLMSCWLMRYSIMTGKIAREGVHVPVEYEPDIMTRLRVKDVASTDVVSLRDTDLVKEAIVWTRAQPEVHPSFPVLDASGNIAGVVTLRELDAHGAAAATAEHKLAQLVGRPPITVFDDDSLHAAIELMLIHDIGRLPVVTRADPRKVVGYLTRSDILSAYHGHFDRTRRVQRHIQLPN